MRNYLLGVRYMVLAATCLAGMAVPVAAQTEPCSTLRGKASDYEFRLNPSGTVTAKAPGLTVVVRSKCVRFEADYYDVSSGKPVAKFAAPVPVASVEPVQRVTIEYASGRREVVE